MKSYAILFLGNQMGVSSVRRILLDQAQWCLDRRHQRAVAMRSRTPWEYGIETRSE